MRRRATHWRRDERGFTLIELLVVMLILGILASISIPAYMGQKARAHDAATREDVRIARLALEAFAVQSGHYGATVADLLDIEPALMSARNLQLSATPTTFIVSADSPAGDNGGTFSMVRDPGGHVTRQCANHGSGGCRATADAAGNYW
jgi:prepilin-type N-terminal cleavage/methylation domain-containing protein